MKLNINKACDLNSISILPPHNRRSTGVSTGPSTSVLGGGNGGQVSLSQQSFSQGLSSQQGGTLSQFSQSSLDELVVNDHRRFGSQERETSVKRISCPAPGPYTREDSQRFGSQERETSVKRISCSAPGPYTREDSQVPMPRSSANLMRRWSSTSTPDNKCQINEEVEHRIASIETSLTRFGMILDSIQSDVMQINKGTKEISLEVESIRQKLSIQDDLLHVLNRGQEDIRATLDACIKLLTDQLDRSASKNKFQETLAVVLALPEQIEVCLFKLKNELSKSLSEELQALTSTLGASVVNKTTPPMLLPKVTGSDSCSHMAHKISEPVPLKVVDPSPLTASSKIEMGGWKRVKGGQDSVITKNSCNPPKQKRVTPIEQVPTSANVSDEDLDADFSCLLVGQQTDVDNDLMKEAQKQTEHILRKARRRKRRLCNTVIVD